MLPREQWMNRILSISREIASKEFQERAWLSGQPSTSSPTEVYNQLFDDAAFRWFFEKYSGDFTTTQTEAWKKFENELDKYGVKLSVSAHERVVFDDPVWQVVREAAARFVAAFEK